MQELLFLSSDPIDDEDVIQRIANHIIANLPGRFKLVIHIYTNPDALARAFNTGYDDAHAGGLCINPYQYGTSEYNFYGDGWGVYNAQQRLDM